MLASRLRESREKRGLTQSELAKRTGLHNQQIYKLESGISDPKGDTLTRIARELEVSVDYLVGLVNEPSEYIRETNLTPMESRLIWAVRTGQIVEALKAVTALSEKDNQPDISPSQITVDS
jgi:transcriptional regulator with XRE-family HTH domain